MNRDPFASHRLAASGDPTVKGDSEHALKAVIHDVCALLTSATPRTSLVNSKGSSGAAERARQSVEGMARTLRFDLLGRTNVAVGSDLPITSWMVRHAAWLLSHFQAGTDDGKTAYARQFQKLRVICALLLNGSCGRIRRSSLRSCEAAGSMVGTITDKRRSPQLAREWTSLWFARYDVCRYQDARSQVLWWPCGARPLPDDQAKRVLATRPLWRGTLWSEK